MQHLQRRHSSPEDATPIGAIHLRRMQPAAAAPFVSFQPPPTHEHLSELAGRARQRPRSGPRGPRSDPCVQPELHSRQAIHRRRTHARPPICSSTAPARRTSQLLRPRPAGLHRSPRPPPPQPAGPASSGPTKPAASSSASSTTAHADEDLGPPPGFRMTCAC